MPSAKTHWHDDVPAFVTFDVQRSHALENKHDLLFTELFAFYLHSIETITVPDQ